MKRMLAIVLCLIMALSCAAIAETAEKQSMGTVTMNGAFELKGVIPDGYELIVIAQEDAYYLALVISEDPAKPILTISIGFEELMSEVKRLNDIDDEGLAKIEETFTEMDTVEISYTETAFGTKVMVIKEIDDEVDFIDFYTVYNGYELEFVLSAGPEAEGGITEEQIQMVIDFMSDMDFIPLDEE